jgi:hypothetical protein
MESNPHRLYPTLWALSGDLTEFAISYGIPVLLAAIVARGWEPICAAPSGGVFWSRVSGEVFRCDGDLCGRVAGAEFEGGC